MNFDELKICTRCNSDACYKQEVSKDISLELCYGCGFQHNSIMVKDSDFYKEQMEILPEIYKVLMDEDEEEKIWMPTSINIKDKGMVFASGQNRENWNWGAVKAVLIPEEDREKYKDEKYRADMSTIKYFKERDFMDALSYIGMLPE
tara:strand:- start:667 stop:1107 length:441 start_codon:yes stop_codon:yes gene_type:complete